MNPPKKNEDHHFTSFAMGATIGVAAALLLGTEEGRKILKKILDAIPDKYKKIPEALISQPKSETPPTPVITSFETPHHVTYEPEPPPPPTPAIRPPHPL